MATYNLATQTVSSLSVGDIVNCSYTGTVKSITLPKGIFRLECWGAAGQKATNSYSDTSNAQYYSGGYAAGTLTLQAPQTLYIAVGETSYNKNRQTPGMFNGGGAKYSSGSSYLDNGLGGGATHIATLPHTFSTDNQYRQVASSDGLLSRILVAGGGGSGRGTSDECYGGYVPAYTTSGTYCGKLNSAGSTQGSVGAGFGYGDTCYGLSDDHAAGGGGWYGGGSNGDSYGGGGSSFAWCSTYQNYVPSGWKVSTDLFLEDVKFYCGAQAMPSYSSNSTMYGNQMADGYCRITFIDSLGPLELQKGDVLSYSYSGAVKRIILPKGTYKLECWGAQGGSYSSYYGGLGGYSVGSLTLKDESTTLFIYVGEQPAQTTSTSPGGFNGGGQASYHSYAGTTSYCQGGGGASDIRVGQDSLYARVIVAGGGGGSASTDDRIVKYGGGTTGGCSNSDYKATQTSAGSRGSFGIGANGDLEVSNFRYASGGGGGGWYGGGATSSYDDNISDLLNQNGGGSGYVYTSSTASSYPSGCLLTSKYYLTDAQTIGGNQSFASTSGGTETGHSGNGYVKITLIKTGIDVVCEDRVTNSSGTLLGTLESKGYDENETANGSDWGSSTTRNAYYTGYTYTGCSSVTVNAEGLKVYRYFKLNTYTISYNNNNGTGAPGAQTKTYGTALTLSSTKPTRARASTGTSYVISFDAGSGSVSTPTITATVYNNYTFKNWNTNSSGTGTAYNSGASYTTESDATLYAQWNTTQETDQITLPTPTHDLMSFAGWYNQNGTKIGDAGAKYTPTAKLDLHAEWIAPNNLYTPYIYIDGKWVEYQPFVYTSSGFTQHSSFIGPKT